MEKYFLVFLIFLSSCASIHHQADSTHCPKNIVSPGNYGIIVKNAPVFELERAGYTKHNLIQLKKIGDTEFRTYSDWITERPGDTITFFIEKGRITGWKRSGEIKKVLNRDI